MLQGIHGNPSIEASLGRAFVVDETPGCPVKLAYLAKQHKIPYAEVVAEVETVFQSCMFPSQFKHHGTCVRSGIHNDLVLARFTMFDFPRLGAAEHMRIEVTHGKTKTDW